MTTETKPARYRKKPVVIEAMRLDFAHETGGHGANYRDVMQWVNGGEPLPDPRSAKWLELPAYPDGFTLIIPTLEGDMVASDGDWIIRGVAGEFYPCKPDIFAATYEPDGVEVVDLGRAGTTIVPVVRSAR